MIDSIINRNTCIRAGYSFFWIAFVLFFVYTNLISIMFLKSSDFSLEYLTIQSNSSAMFVNFGIIFMLGVDNMHHKYTNNRQFMGFVFFSVLVIMALHVHARCYCDNSNDYIELLKTSWVSYLLQGLFVGILLVLRFKTTEIIKIKIDKVL